MSRATWLRTAAGLALAVAAAAPAAAQEWVGRGRMVVTVRSAATQEPVAGAKVSASMVEDPKVTPGLDWRTDKKGKFSYLGLKGGNWMVRVEAEGFEPWVGPVEVYSQGMPEALLVPLKPLPAQVLESQKLSKEMEKARTVVDEGAAKAIAGDLDGSRAAYEQALALLPADDQPGILVALADLAIRQNRLEDAKALLNRALEINPQHLGALRTLCSVEASQGKVVEAEALLARIPADAEIHPVTLLNIAMAHYNQHESAQAKVFLDRAIAQHPEVGVSHYYRGLVGLSLDDKPGARADFERYLALEPTGDKRSEVEEYVRYLAGEGTPK
jgi:hypothetical protein